MLVISFLLLLFRAKIWEVLNRFKIPLFHHISEKKLLWHYIVSSKKNSILFTHPWPFSKSKFNLKSDSINLVAPASPIECLLYLPNVRAIQYKLGPGRLTRVGNSNVLRLLVCCYGNPSHSCLSAFRKKKKLVENQGFKCSFLIFILTKSKSNRLSSTIGGNREINQLCTRRHKCQI